MEIYEYKTNGRISHVTCAQIFHRFSSSPQQAYVDWTQMQQKRKEDLHVQIRITWLIPLLFLVDFSFVLFISYFMFYLFQTLPLIEVSWT